MVNTPDSNVYKVGGAVRDEQLGRDPNDDDFVVVGLTPEEMRERGFDEPVGESFSVFIHPETGDEWALARTETIGTDSDGKRTVPTGPSVTLEDDLWRRDLTINAMAQDVHTGELIDPYGGMDDLEDQVFRHVSPAFAEDPLRVLRVATFSARLPEFDIAPETITLCRTLAPELETIAPNRIREELIKMFNKAEEPRRFFDTLRELNALETVFPVLDKLTRIPAGPTEYHKEGSTYEHTMRVLEEAHAINPTNERLLWAALGHDLGKVLTDESKLPSHPKHTKVGPDAVDLFANKIKLGNERRQVMKDAARFHMRFHKLDELREATLIRMVNTFGTPNLTTNEFVNLGVADGRGKEPQNVKDDPETVEEQLRVAEEAVESFGGEEAFEKFDLDENAGEKVGELILQERIKLVKEGRKELETTGEV